MATQESIDLLMQRLADTHPVQLFQSIDRTKVGIGAVFCCLCQAGRPVTAGEIGDFMSVSSARVTVLLRKMLEKDLIIKQTDPNDARRSLISLSENGRIVIARLHEGANAMLGAIIDRIGMERMEEYISISSRIQEVIATNFESQDIDY